MAHDFNNILTVIQGNASLLNLDLSTEEQGQAVAEILHARLTRQLLTFSRRQVAQPRELDLNEVIQPLTKMLQLLIGERIELTTDYNPQGAPVLADPGMMEQLVMNLSINARDAMPGGGSLEISTRLAQVRESSSQGARPSEFMKLQVRDSGRVIEPEDLPQFFEPFFSTKEVGRGTGLGLATVFGIVQQHKGWITVSSQPGQGTCFCIFLPQPGPPLSVAAPGRAAFSEEGGQETILVVEDEPSLREMLVGILRSQGYQVWAVEAHKDSI